MNKVTRINVIGAGLAGSEACFYLLCKGYEVHLYERRPLVDDHAHSSDLFGELVCSNSLKSSSLSNASGLQKEEMRHMNSITMQAAAECAVPAGNALSVDRDLFAEKITAKLKEFPNLHIHNEDVSSLPDDEITILATGPLTSGPMLETLQNLVGRKSLSFFDASAPIVKKDSLDFSKVYYKSRFAQDDAAYLNAGMDKETYVKFVYELTHAEKAVLHEFDTHYFEGCLPVEVIASRGVETLRHGPMKPFGLWTEEHPKAYAILQLRQDTALGDCYNLVGFQNNLTYPAQRRVFRMIPGLENAEFVRYGLMHRNSYIDSPDVLNDDLSLKSKPNVFVAGQLSGVEGYVESAAQGIIAAINASRRLEGKEYLPLPERTITGALNSYIHHASGKYFAPMNANWSLIPSLKKEQRENFIEEDLAAIDLYWKQAND